MTETPKTLIYKLNYLLYRTNTETGTYHYSLVLPVSYVQVLIFATSYTINISFGADFYDAESKMTSYEFINYIDNLMYMDKESSHIE